MNASSFLVLYPLILGLIASNSGFATEVFRTSDEATSAILALPSETTRGKAIQTLLEDSRGTAIVTALLREGNPEIVRALASRLASAPEAFRAEYVEPLFTFLLSEAAEPGARTRVAAALAAAPEDWITTRLRAWMQSDAPGVERSAALDVLARTHRYRHIEFLIELLQRRRADESQEILNALSHATGITFGADRDAALEWWHEAKQRPVTEWQRLRLRDSLAALRAARASESELETRLSAVMRANYLRESPTARPAVLSQYLHDAVPVVRRLGLELLQEQLTGGVVPSDEILQEARQLLRDTDDRTCAAAVRTVVALRDRADESTFISMLQNGARGELRRALINALGYVGTASSVDILLAILCDRAQQPSVEVVDSLARLQERQLCNEAQQVALQSALVAYATDENFVNPAFEAQVVWTLGLLQQPESRPILNSALNGEKPLVVRQAAIRGLALWGDAEASKAIFALIDNRDPRVRRTALESAGKFVHDREHLEPLLRMSLQRHEPDETNRKLAWRGVNQCLEQADASLLIAAIQSLEAEKSTEAQIVSLCSLGLGQRQGAELSPSTRLMLLDAQSAAHLRAGNRAAALESQVSALQVAAKQTPAADEFCARAFQVTALACAEDKYDVAMAKTIGSVLPDADAFWKAARTAYVDTSDEQNRNAITSLLALPPIEITQAQADELRALIARDTEEFGAVAAPNTEMSGGPTADDS